MKIADRSCQLATAPPGEDVFELVRETVSPVPGGRARGHGALRRVAVECHRDEQVAGDVCAACDHFLNEVPSKDGRSLTVRCMFLDSDDIDTQMTLARELISVDETASVGLAQTRLDERGLKQLVVLCGEVVTGLVSARDLRGSRPLDEVAAFARPLDVVPRTMSIASTARALRSNDLTCVAIVDGAELLGLVTRGDLRRAGVPGL